MTPYIVLKASTGFKDGEDWEEFTVLEIVDSVKLTDDLGRLISRWKINSRTIILVIGKSNSLTKYRF